jgi:hypothetical protein
MLHQTSSTGHQVCVNVMACLGSWGNRKSMQDINLCCLLGWIKDAGAQGLGRSGVAVLG